MTQKVSLIKWSNSFPGIVSNVYTEYPALDMYAIVSLSILVSTTRHIYLNLESSMKLIQIGNTAPNSILTTLSFVWTGVIMSTAIVSRSDWKMVDLFALGDLKVM